ncbi:MAG: DUF427 domain-containing protein [Acidimicrobiia bacterium]|nr:DUF427 domain-containing protein [Acidimicrobiia bacterium]
MSTARGTVRTEPSHKRVRIFFGGQLIVDTDDALYVWEGPHYPQYYVPLDHVADGALDPSPTTKHSPSRGTASHFHVRANGTKALDAAWSYGDSPFPELRGRVRFEFDAMDAWFEEDEEIFVHPRDPSTRVQILPSSRRATVVVDGVVVAATDHPTLLFETGLRRRTYFSKLDVRMDLLTPTETSSRCPYKGTARYWTVNTPAGEHGDLAWSYPSPLRESEQIAGLVAFYDERVDVIVDGERQNRGETNSA